MASLRKATPDDYERVLPLFHSFRTQQVQRWDYLFAPQPGVDHVGYLLEDNNRVVGFLAYTYSDRIVRDQQVRFCNMSNWVVEEPFRHQSLSLLMPALKLKETTITNFTPTPDVLKICRKLGFQDLDGRQRIILPGPHRRSGGAIHSEGFSSHLPSNQAALLEDHNLPHHRHILWARGHEQCLLILNATRKRVAGIQLPMARAHYVSDAEIFSQHATEIVNACVQRFRVTGLIVDERLLKERRPRLSFLRPNYPLIAAYKSDFVRPDEVDALYSELVLLGY